MCSSDLEIVRQGGMSIRTFAEMHGLDEEMEEDAAILTAKRRIEKCEAAGVPLSAAFPEMAPPPPMQPQSNETDPNAGAPQAGAGPAAS